MTQYNDIQPQATYDPLMDWSPLHQILKTGNGVKKLNAWLEQYSYDTHRKGYADVLYNVEMGYLRFIHTGDTDASRKKCLRMQKAFIQIYDFAEQVRILDLFNFMHNEIMVEFYPLLKFDPQNTEHTNLVKKHKLFSNTFTELFHQEHFDVIDFLEKTLNYSFLEQGFEQQLFIFEQTDRKSINRNATLLWNLKNDFSKPYHDIIYTYSIEKEQYLNQRGLHIPSEEVVEHYRQFFDIKKADNPKSLDKEEWDKLYAGLNSYEKVLQYYALHDNLASDNQEKLEENSRLHLKI